MPGSSVAIDGPVASGKSTAAKAVAARLGLLYVDTGAMYRALALAAQRRGADPADERALLDVLREAPVRLEPDPSTPLGYRVFAGPAELGEELFGDEVSRLVSVVSTHGLVRREMVRLQRAFANDGPVVMAGRDIGTVVLPEAPFKFFLTASVDARVARRGIELAAKGAPLEAHVLRALIEERDRLDSTRDVAPLKPALGSVVIDSSAMDAQEVVERIVAFVRAGEAGTAP